MEPQYGVIIALTIGMVIGVPFIVFMIHVIQRLRYLKSENRTIEGELFVTDEGEIYSEFGIDFEEIKARDTILLKVHHIKSGGSIDEREHS